MSGPTKHALDPLAAAHAAVLSTKSGLGTAEKKLKYAAGADRPRALAAVSNARRLHAEALMTLRIREIAASAPPLSTAQRAHLSALIESVGAVPDSKPAAPSLLKEGEEAGFEAGIASPDRVEPASAGERKTQ